MSERDFAFSKMARDSRPDATSGEPDIYQLLIVIEGAPPPASRLGFN